MKKNIFSLGVLAAAAIALVGCAKTETNVPEVKGTGIPYRSRYSTLQDLDAGRPTEIDMLCGTAVRLGRKYGVPTPYNEMAYHCIRVLEQKNAGRFDYD